MAARDSAPARIVTAADIAWCAGAKEPWRHNWARLNRLKARPPFGIHDAVEASIAWHLVSAVGGKKATQAWDVIRPPLRQLTLATDDVWVIVASTGPRHTAVEGAAAAATAAVALEVPCSILPVAAVVARAKDRYGDLIAGRRDTGGHVSDIRERQRGR